MMSELINMDPAFALQTLLAVSLLIAGVLATRKYIARKFGAGVAYALWAIPVARLVVPPISSPISWTSFLGTWATPQPAPAPPIAHAATDMGNHVFVAPPPPAAPPSLTLLETSSGAGLIEPVWAGLLWPTLMAIWLGGTLYMLVRSSLAHRSFMQTVRREQEYASPTLLALAEDVARKIGLKRTPLVVTSFISSGPLVSGLLRPTVLLPVWFEEDYDQTQQRAALAHELMHIKRGDLWALQISEIVIACLWFNPLAYHARKAFRTDQEAACDSDVLKSGTATRYEYGQTLMKAVQISLPERMTAAASLPLTHALKERMLRMTTPAPSRSRRIFGAGLAALLGSVGVMSTACVAANAEETSEPHSLVIADGHVSLNGEEIKDRQIMILGDPFEVDGISPDLDIHIDELTTQIDVETQELETLLSVIPEPEIGQLDPAFEHEFEMALNFTDGTMPKTEEEWEVWAEKVEAYAEEWEVRAEAIAEQADAHTQVWVTKFEPRIKEFEARIEAHAEELEKQIDLQFGGEFEARIENTQLVLSDLIEACRDADMTDGDTRVLKGNTKDNKSIKILCAKGEPGILTADATINAIMARSDLEREEKDFFRHRVDGRRSHVITIERSTSDEIQPDTDTSE